MAPITTALLFWYTTPGPRHVLYFMEPDFGYLFSSLTILTGHVPWYVDHPGTPLELLGAATLLVRYYLTGGSGGFVADFLRHPVGAQRAEVVVQLTLLLAAQWYCGRRLLRAGFSGAIVIAAQLVPFLVWDAIEYLDHVNPETLLLATGFLFVGLIADAGTTARTPARAVAVGSAFGLLCALKVNALALFPCLFLLPRPRDWLASAAAAIAAFFVCTALCWQHYPRMFGWFFALLGHAGNYGLGEPVPFTASGLADNAKLLLTSHGIGPLLILLVASPLLLALPPPAGEVPRRWQPLAACLLVLVAIVVKHPATRYFVVAGVPLSLMVLRLQALPKRFHPVALCLLLQLPLLFYPNGIPWLRRWRIGGDRVAARLDRELKGRYRDCAIGVLQTAPISAYTLFGGDFSTAKEDFWLELREAFPRFLFLQDGMIRTFGDLNLSRRDWASFAFSAPCRIFVGDPHSSVAAQESLGETLHEVEEQGNAQYRFYQLTPEAEGRLRDSLRFPEKPLAPGTRTRPLPVFPGPEPAHPSQI